jgi:hypothetical protein
MKALAIWVWAILWAAPALADPPADQSSSSPPADNGPAQANGAGAGGESAPNAKTKDKGEKQEPKIGRVEVAGVSGEESAAAKELTVTLDTAELDYRLSVAEVAHETVPELALAVEPLVDEAGRQYRMSWGTGEGKEQDMAVIAKPFAPFARTSVVLRATLPELGTYSAAITPFWGKAPHQKLILKVVRRRPTLSLTIGDPTTFHQDGQTGAASFPLTLQETAGNELRLDRPVLVSLGELRGADAKAITLAHATKLEVKVDGKVLGAQDKLVLERGGAKTIVLGVTPLPGPGKYEARLRFPAAGAVPVEKTVTLYARSPAFIAWILIGLGVILSAVLKWWATEEQPRLLLQQRGSALGLELEAALRQPDLDETERGLGAAAQAKLAELLSTISQGRSDSVAVDNQALVISLVRNWIAQHRSVRQVQFELIREEFLGKLAPIRDDLAEDGVEAAKLKEHQATLRVLPSQLSAAVRKQTLMSDLAKLKPEMKEQAEWEALDSQVQALLKQGDMDGAAARLAQERDRVIAQRSAARAITGGTLGPAEIAATRAELTTSAFAGFNTPVFEEALAWTLKRLRRGMVAEIAINGVILFIAVVLGMKALYVDDLVWGGWDSWLVAFLWGLGLQQFTYGGVGSVVDKLSKTGS